MRAVAGIGQNHGAGHAWFDDDAVVRVEFEHNPLAHAADDRDCAPDRAATKRAEIGSHLDRLQSRARFSAIANGAARDGCNAAAHGLDFGEFGHWQDLIDGGWMLSL